MRRILALMLLSVALSAGACSTPVTGRDPMNPCFDDVILDDVNQLTCGHALDLANARLGWLHWPISAVDYRGNVCPPNARCAMPFGKIAAWDQAWIIYRFVIGDPVMIQVAPTAVRGVFVANEPVPLPDWLLEELEGIDVAERIAAR